MKIRVGGGECRAGGGKFRAGGGNFRAAGCSPLLFLFMGNTIGNNLGLILSIFKLKPMFKHYVNLMI